ncbi:Nitrogen fixation regulatory protein fixK [Sulfitobacter noctilucae]|uniref:Crp/Fnr family transcriptional regulator n=1 Tax=Sulfitobacter noctilucae TaxID=1342302 RepID=UPI0004699C42|nr:Crp/Fnr family transcriptional regulator [Sulfitobacter noctilucae]KIN65826.1 Nitrogen fixation regulatory protein fixK [Sulfitobacter noctilucae]
MTTQCENCPLHRKDLFKTMSREELEYMQKFKVGELTVDPGTPLLMEGSNAAQMFTALSGMGIREKMLENGERQVLSFVFPGDFIGLQAGVLGEMGHSVEARTHMRLCVFDRSEFWSFLRAHPSRAFDITWLSAVEEHFLGESLATLGQRTAIQAVSWALVRVFLRGHALGLVTHNQLSFPFTQRDLADALGLSLVHTNKTLAKLKDHQLAAWQDGILQINNLDKLAELGITSTDMPQQRPLM